MGNPHKGEVTVEAEGVKYIWRFSTGAIAALENHLDRGVFDICEELASWAPPTDAQGKFLPETADEARARNKRIRLGFCRTIFWSGFADNHPDMTVQKAGDLMEAVGGLSGALAVISEGVGMAFPKPEASGTARPLKGSRSAGTGRASGNNGARSISTRTPSG